MQVETYEVTESDAAGCVDSKEEVARLALDLGLEKQLLLLKGDKKGVFPYRRMTTEEERVYGVILMQHTPLADFEDSVIPLRVLQVIAHVRESCNEIIPYLEVWHPRTKTDPILVGKKEKYSSENYILARWGEVLESLPVLRAKVITILTEKAKAKGAKMLLELQTAIASPEERVLRYLDGDDSSYVPTLYA